MITRLAAQDLRGLTFGINLAPVTVFIGPNGSGKTTRLGVLDMALRGPKSPYWPPADSAGCVVEVDVDGLSVTRSRSKALIGGAKAKAEDVNVLFNSTHIAPWAASCLWGGDADQRAIYLLGILSEQGLGPRDPQLIDTIIAAVGAADLGALTAAITTADEERSTAAAALRALGSPLAQEPLLERDPAVIEAEIAELDRLLAVPSHTESDHLRRDLALMSDEDGRLEALAAALAGEVAAGLEAVARLKLESQQIWDPVATPVDAVSKEVLRSWREKQTQIAVATGELGATERANARLQQQVSEARERLLPRIDQARARLLQVDVAVAPTFSAAAFSKQRDGLLAERSLALAERARLGVRLQNESRRAALKAEEQAAVARRDALCRLRAHAVRDALADVLAEADRHLRTMYPSPPPIRIDDNLELTLGAPNSAGAHLTLLRSAGVLAQVALLLALVVRASSPTRKPVLVLDDLEVVNASTRTQLVHVLHALVNSGVIAQALVAAVADGWTPPTLTGVLTVSL